MRQWVKCTWRMEWTRSGTSEKQVSRNLPKVFCCCCFSKYQKEWLLTDMFVVFLFLYVEQVAGCVPKYKEHKNRRRKRRGFLCAFAECSSLWDVLTSLDCVCFSPTKKTFFFFSAQEWHSQWVFFRAKRQPQSASVGVFETKATVPC